MQRFSHQASSVMEKKIFKGFYHIWSWPPPWSMDGNNFSNLSFPCPKEAPNEIWATLARRLQRRSRLKFSTFFQYKGIGKQIWPCRKKVKCQCTTFILAILVDLRPQWFMQRFSPKASSVLEKILKVFTISGHDGHLGQWTVTILAIFRSPNLRRLHMKFEQNLPGDFRGEVVWKC